MSGNTLKTSTAMSFLPVSSTLSLETDARTATSSARLIARMVARAAGSLRRAIEGRYAVTDILSEVRPDYRVPFFNPKPGGG